MNKMFKYIGCALAAALVIFACSPDEFEGANESGLPTVSGRSIVVSTDQETNTATFYVTGDMTGCYPVWYLDGSNYSILPTASYTSLSAGTHTLQAYLLNRNGVSQAALEAEFTFENTITDYTVYFNRLCDKEWRIAYTEAGHMGCGESGSDGSNWWSAGVNDKADYGVYDDRITFTHSDSDEADSGTYTYDPGEGGTVYVNYGTTTLNTTGATEDFMMEVSSQTAGFEFVDGTYDGEACLYLQFDPYTYLPYIPNDNIWADPYYRIESLTNTRLAIVCDDGSIAWRLVFTSREDTGLDEGDDDTSTDTMNWDWSSDENLWKPVDMGDAFVSVSQWFADDNWSQISDAEWSHTDGDDEWSLVIPEGIGSSQWQGQFAIHTSLAMSGSQFYNVYLVMNMDNDASGVTIKLTEDGNDNNYFFADRHSITADTDYIFKAKNVTLAEGTDASSMAFFFDFGGTPAGTNVTISNIYIVESDGTDDDEDTAVSYNWDYDASYNLWTAVDEGTAFDSVYEWFADDGWSEITAPSYTHSGSEWELTIPSGMGSSQWQGQFHIISTLSASASKAYNIYFLMDMDNDASSVTVKMTDASDDNNYFMTDVISVTADETYIYKVTNVTLSAGTDASAIKLVFDFGGTPAGTVVNIHDIFFAEADSDETSNGSSSGSGSETVTLDYNSDGNVWKAVDEGTSFDSVYEWFADANWSEMTAPSYTHSGSSYTLTLPSGMGGSEWQGQFHIISSLSLSGSSTYSFGCKITADDDISRMTVKVTDNTNNSNLCYYNNAISFEAGTYTIAETGLAWNGGDVSQLSIVFDFGGCNAYTEVTISDIILIQE